MGKSYSQDLRDRVIDAVEREGITFKKRRWSRASRIAPT